MKREAQMHPDAAAWNKWIGSAEGKKCMESGAAGVYLENRLWHAFMAGIEHENQMKEKQNDYTDP